MFLRNNRAVGFSDAGLYVGSINQGPVTVYDNVTIGNNRGILVEESDGTVRVLENLSRGNDLPGESSTTAGIALADADHIVLRGNRANRNGDYGIHLAGPRRERLGQQPSHRQHGDPERHNRLPGRWER